MPAVAPHLLTLLETALQMAVATGAVVWGMPTRPWRARTALAVAAAMAAVCLLGALGPGLGVLRVGTPAESLVTFSLLLACSCLLVREVMDMGTSSAIFCASAGFLLQNLASSLAASALLVVGLWGRGAVTHVVVWLCLLAVLAVVRWLFARYVGGAGAPVVGSRGAMVMCLLVIVVSILDDSLFWSISDAYGVSPAHQLALRAVHMVLGVSVLFMEFEMVFRKSALGEVRRLSCPLDAQRRQYEMSRRTIESVNLRAHDIRHQIRHLSEAGAAGGVGSDVLAEIAREVDVYDTIADTGNDALDVVLTEKGLLCRREGVTLSVIADGAALGFMAPTDVYSFFGNALENAMEGVRAAGDAMPRSIALDIRQKVGAVCIHMENGCAGGVRFVDGLPQTTKGDRASHGFGTKSMRLVIERYGGILTMGVRGHIFELDALIPRPEDDTACGRAAST